MTTTKKRPITKAAKSRKPARRRPAVAVARPYLTSDMAAEIAGLASAATLHGFREGLATVAANARTAKPAVAIQTLPVKVLADGTRCAEGDTRTDHVAVLFPDGTMIHTATLCTPKGEYLPSWQACVDACSALRALGHEDWQLASRQDWERYVLDLARHEPAVDTNLFPGIKPAWHWTSTPAAWSADSAWGVGAGYGYVFNGHRNGGGFALAVRRAGQ